MHKSVTDLKTLFAISALTVAVAACDSSSDSSESTSTNNPPVWVTEPSVVIEANIAIDSSAYGVTDFYVSDIDGDDDVDIFAGRSGDERVTWYENDGEGNYTPYDVSTYAETSSLIYVADIDADNDPDILTANGSSVVMYENVGDMNFFEDEIEVVSFSLQRLYEFAVEDLDSDGDLDLLTVGWADIYWHENNGDLTFTAHDIGSFVDSVDSQAVDLDADGDLDIVASDGDDDSVSWYENDGNGNFSRSYVSAFNSVGPQSLYTVDVDGDSDLDILVTTYNDGFYWLENDGAQEFTLHEIDSAGADDSDEIIATDLDRDGDIDIFLTHRGDDEFFWYENDGSQNFTRAIFSDSVDGADALALADVNGDGFDDVLVSGYYDYEILWYGGFEYQLVNVAENEAFVVLSEATDEDTDQTLTYSIVGGDDSALFEIDASGSVSFLAGKTIANPEDADGDNVYEVVIAATDGFDTIEKEIHVTVLAAE